MTEPMTRLTAERLGSEALEFAAELVRSDLQLPAADPRVLERARRRLRAADAREARRLWRPAVAVAVLALSSFAAAAVVRWTPLWPLLRSREAFVSVPARPTPPHNAMHEAEHAAPSAPLELNGVGVDETSAAPPLVRRGPRKRALAAVPTDERAPSPGAEPTSAAGGTPARIEGPLVGESALLGEALRALNLRRDALASLHALDAYDARYPAGVLRREALVARIDALLALGRRTEALQLLEKAGDLTALPKARELEVLRGELRAQGGNCAGAGSDFDAALDERGPLAERALWGLAACGSRPHLERYLREYPNGTFAAQARAALGP
jgi:tetratricopeptide (TPR) repeat protein